MYTLHLDIETFSPVPITHGTHRYAEEAEVIIVQWAIDEGPVTVWDLTDGTHPEWQTKLEAMIDIADRVVIHNSPFERTVLRRHGVGIPLDKIEDTMVLALLHSLPGKLEQICDILALGTDKAKDKRGKRLIQLFTKPRPKNIKTRRATRDTHPAEWQEFLEYAERDVVATREVHKRLPRWNYSPRERRLWQLDQAVNDDGFLCDVALAHAARGAFDRASGALAVAAHAATGGAVASATQRGRLLAYLKDERGLDIADLQKGTLERLLRGDLSAETRELLEIRQKASATSPAKYGALINAVSADGRLRGAIQFSGAARTRRDAGRIFQPQNLPRCPDWFDGDAQEETVAAFKADCADLLYDDVVDRCTYAIRGCVVVERDAMVCVADLSNIEGRVLAWLAGEQWKLEAFKAYDRGEGHDLYKVTAGRILGKDPADITKSERQTQGKVPELAGGYQGSVGAYRKMGGPVFEAMTDDEILVIVRGWRAGHPATRSFWYELDNAAREVVSDPSKSITTRGPLTFDIKRGPDGCDWMRIKLPSGAYLCYRNPHMQREVCERCGGTGKVGFEYEGATLEMSCTECGGEGLKSEKIAYEGVDQYTRQWKVLNTYGGKLCIAKGTPVLTHSGWLPIEQVTHRHRVWDGVEFVRHLGLARQGVKEVIKAHGVWMTPDHEVLTTAGWKCASQSERFDRAAVRLPDGYELSGGGWQEKSVGFPLRVWRRSADARDGGDETAQARSADIVRLQAPGDHVGAEDDARHVAPQSLPRVAEHERPLPPTLASSVGALRRAWGNSVRALAEVLPRLLGGHGAHVPGGSDAGAAGQLRRILAGKLRLARQNRAGAQQANEQPDTHAVGRADRSRSGGSRGTEPKHGLLPDSSGRAGISASGSPRLWAEVFDLVSCGPRKRFTVMGDDGRALLVHNCENVVQTVARDVFMSGFERAMAAGFRVVLRVHDELVAEVPKSSGLNAKQLAGLMAQNDSWNLGLPLAAAGDDLPRYRKA